MHTLKGKITEILDGISIDWERKNELSTAILHMLEEHFTVSKLDLECGEVTIKSNNHSIGTEILLNGKSISVTQLEWDLCADDGFGKLRLTFI